MGVHPVTAWSVLVENSSLLEGTAWEHLNAQVGSDPGVVLYVESMEASLTESIQTATMEIEMLGAGLYEEILQASLAVEELASSVVDTELNVAMVDLSVDASLSDITLSATLLEEAL